MAKQNPRKPIGRGSPTPGNTFRNRSGVTPGGRQYDATMVTKADGKKMFVGRVGSSRDRMGEVRGGDQKIGKTKFTGNKVIFKSHTKPKK